MSLTHILNSMEPNEIQTKVLTYCREHYTEPSMIVDMVIKLQNVVSYATLFTWCIRESSDVFTSVIKVASLLKTKDIEQINNDIAGVQILGAVAGVRLNELNDSEQDCKKWIDALYGDSPFESYNYCLLNHNDSFESKHIHLLQNIIKMPWMCLDISNTGPLCLRIDPNLKVTNTDARFAIFVRIYLYESFLFFSPDPINTLEVSQFIIDLYNSVNGNHELECKIMMHLHRILEKVGEKDVKALNVVTDTILKNLNANFRSMFNISINGSYSTIRQLKKFYSKELVVIFCKYIPEPELWYPDYESRVLIYQQYELQGIANGERILHNMVVELIEIYARELFRKGFTETNVYETTSLRYNILYEDEETKKKFAIWLKSLVLNVQNELKSSC